jgi:outer membrane autotransporter protein
LVDAPGEQATVATTFLGVRATYTDGGLTADLGVTYGIHSIDASHTVEFPGLAEATRAEAKARTLIADGQLAYRVSLAGLELQPYARASLIRLATDEFRETGGLSSLTLLAQRDTIAQSFLGLRASAQIRLFGSLRVTPRLDAAWQHGWAGLSGERRLLFAGAADAFTVSNALAPRDSLKLNAGADIALGALRLSATYQENVGALWSDRSGRVTATLHF